MDLPAQASKPPVNQCTWEWEKLLRPHNTPQLFQEHVLSILLCVNHWGAAAHFADPRHCHPQYPPWIWRKAVSHQI